jgi:carbamoyltransferase
VVQNSTLARKVLCSRQFENVWMTPVTNNCCAALGASLLGYFQKNNRISNGKNFVSELPFLGSSYSRHDIELSLSLKKVESVAVDAEQQLLDLVCNFLESGKVVGWFQERSVFGGHAPGNRCVLADPRQSGILSHLNKVLKQHENYRTYSVSILRDELGSFYYLPPTASFYSMMNFSLLLKEQYRRRSDKQEGSESETPDSSFSLFPSITRPDASSRVHVVDPEASPMFSRLLRNFRARCGCPMLLNTSLNSYNNPVVRTPAEAIDCFINSGMDVLVLGNRILRKA